jgi:hypothetical protein
MNRYVRVNLSTKVIETVPEPLGSNYRNISGFFNLSEDILADLTELGYDNVGFLNFATSDFSTYTHDALYLDYVKGVFIRVVKNNFRGERTRQFIHNNISYNLTPDFLSTLLIYEFAGDTTNITFESNDGFETLSKVDFDAFLAAVSQKHQDIAEVAKAKVTEINACTTLAELQAIQVDDIFINAY